MISFETLNKFGRDGFDAAVKSAGAMTNGLQAAAGQTAEFAKISVEQCGQAAERLMGARSVDAVAQIQTEYLRASYERTVAQFGRMGELATSTVKQASEPVEALFSQSAGRAA